MNNNNECPFPSGSKVVGYLRDSGGDEQELSLRQQSGVIKKWVQEHSLILTKIYQDEAQPGSSVVKREAFMDMVTHFRDGAKEDGVVIWSYSRFSRDIDDAAFYKSDLRRRGYLIHSLTDSIPSGLDGYLLESVLAWKDARFLEDLSRDVKRGLAHLVTEYKAVPGTPPRGFKREPLHIGKRRSGEDRIVHRWVPDPEMVPIVQKAFEMRAAGKTYRQIHDETHLFGSKNSYVPFFRNKLFIGILKFGDLEIVDYCEPLIDKDIWNKVQKLHRQRSLMNNGAYHPRRMRGSFILSGLLFCAKCDSPMNGHVISRSEGGRWTYYVCSRRKRRRDCDAIHIPQESIELRVLDELKSKILTPENLSRLQEELRIVYDERRKGRVGEREHLSKQLNKIAHQIANVTEAVARTGGSHALLDKLKKLEVEEGEIIIKIADLERRPEPELDVDLHELSDLVIRALSGSRLKGEENRIQIKELLRGFIYRIEVVRDKKTVTGTIYYYKPEIKGKDKKKEANPLMPINPEPLGALHRHYFKGKLKRRNEKKAP